MIDINVNGNLNMYYAIDEIITGTLVSIAVSIAYFFLKGYISALITNGNVSSTLLGY